MDFSDAKPSEITFKQPLASFVSSVTFLVEVRSILCVMKVHNGNATSYINESTAYKRLREHGLCDSGIIPQLYGFMENIDVRHFQPHLEMYLLEKLSPSAIFTEYIPHMRKIIPQLYTERRMQKFISGLREIHQALVLHRDVKPKNMMVVESDPEKVVWLNFDWAQTLHADNPHDQARDRYIKDEELDLSEFAEKLKRDSKRGEIHDTHKYYWI